MDLYSISLAYDMIEWFIERFDDVIKNIADFDQFNWLILYTDALPWMLIGVTLTYWSIFRPQVEKALVTIDI